MWSFIGELLAKLITLLGVYQAGKNKQLKERLEERLEAKEDARRRKQEIDNLSDDELNERMRKRKDG